MAFEFMLLLQWLPRAECKCPLREEGNKNKGSGYPLEAIGWKKYSRCMR
jgi:hypothetical protein